ncbi:hypothetical protein BT93_I0234 [Corymbia citriodora subsp. variegata]|nr:hypothetical protein BT93_I0234 [Corymbia citriodora subsp. variegata]
MDMDDSSCLLTSPIIEYFNPIEMMVQPHKVCQLHRLSVLSLLPLSPPRPPSLRLCRFSPLRAPGHLRTQPPAASAPSRSRTIVMASSRLRSLFPVGSAAAPENGGSGGGNGSASSAAASGSGLGYYEDDEGSRRVRDWILARFALFCRVRVGCVLR